MSEQVLKSDRDFKSLYIRSKDALSFAATNI